MTTVGRITQLTTAGTEARGCPARRHIEAILAHCREAGFTNLSRSMLIGMAQEAERAAKECYTAGLCSGCAQSTQASTTSIKPSRPVRRKTS
jgi:hypothetical protein